MKTVRFSQVVERCCKPEPYTLWVDPASDPEFQAALKGNRVMSVHQEAGVSNKDYGQIGYTKDSHANLFVFPKSLQPFDGCRVVGVKYDLLDAAPSAKPTKKVARTLDIEVASPKSKNAKVAEAKPGKAQPARVEPEKVKAPEVTVALRQTKAAQESAAPAFAALHLLHLEDGKEESPEPKRKEKPDEQPVKPQAKPAGNYDRLVSQVREAMIELKDGKVVLAYQTLEQALRE